MNRIKLLIAGIFLFSLILIPFILLKKVPASVSECLKINTSSGSGTLNDCISDVAEAKSDAGICDYIEEQFFGRTYEHRDCVKAANRNNSRNGSWAKVESSTDTVLHVDDKVNEWCFQHAIHNTKISYYMNLGYPKFTAIDYYLDVSPACREKILSASEDSCNINTTYINYQDRICQMYIALYQGIEQNLSASEICNGLEAAESCHEIYAFIKNDPWGCSLSGYKTEECFLSYAIIHHDMSQCTNARSTRYYKDYADDCYFFFALDSDDEEICKRISDVNEQHHCAAMVFAIRGD